MFWISVTVIRSLDTRPDNQALTVTSTFLLFEFFEIFSFFLVSFLFLVGCCMYFIEKIKAVCGFDSPKMKPRANLPITNVNQVLYYRPYQSPFFSSLMFRMYTFQDLINCEDNIAFVEVVWNERYNGKDNKYDVVYANPLRAGLLSTVSHWFLGGSPQY